MHPSRSAQVQILLPITLYTVDPLLLQIANSSIGDEASSSEQMHLPSNSSTPSSEVQQPIFGKTSSLFLHIAYIMSHIVCRLQDSSIVDEALSSELTHLPSISSAPIPEVEAVLRTADHWHFDAFKLTEASQGYPLSTLAFWLMQQSRVAREFSKPSLSLNQCPTALSVRHTAADALRTSI